MSLDKGIDRVKMGSGLQSLCQAFDVVISLACSEAWQVLTQRETPVLGSGRGGGQTSQISEDLRNLHDSGDDLLLEDQPGTPGGRCRDVCLLQAAGLHKV